MATYVRAAGAHVAERIAPEPGSDDEARLEQLAADPASGWRRVEDAEGGEARGSSPSAPIGDRPSQAANKAVWVDWAISQGMDHEQAEDLTKAELIDLASSLTADEEE